MFSTGKLALQLILFFRNYLFHEHRKNYTFTSHAQQDANNFGKNAFLVIPSIGTE